MKMIKHQRNNNPSSASFASSPSSSLLLTLLNQKEEHDPRTIVYCDEDEFVKQLPIQPKECNTDKCEFLSIPDLPPDADFTVAEGILADLAFKSSPEVPKTIMVEGGGTLSSVFLPAATHCLIVTSPHVVFPETGSVSCAGLSKNRDALVKSGMELVGRTNVGGDAVEFWRKNPEPMHLSGESDLLEFLK
jgi:riboflavin biosynthesis pyrimidine reductase